MADGFSLRGKFSHEEEKEIREWMVENGYSLEEKGTQNKFVKKAIFDYIRNNSKINPYDPLDKVKADFEKISKRDETLRKEKKPGPRRIKKKRGRPNS